MKKLFLALLILSGCSNIEIQPVGNSLTLSRKDLSKESKLYLQESGVTHFVPAESEKEEYYSGLETIPNYRKYLLMECAILLHKEQGLDLTKPVYASNPKWNNIQNWYAMYFNFQTTNVADLTDSTMECDLAINKNKEVSEYQLRKSVLHIQKNN